MRFDALTALYSMLSKRLEGVDVSPLLCPEIQFVPLLVQSMDEDWYVDTRKVACCAMEAFIKACGAQMSDELRRSIYPELNKRMDDSSNDVRIATAAAVAAFARHALPETYCDTNSGCATELYHLVCALEHGSVSIGKTLASHHTCHHTCQLCYSHSLVLFPFVWYCTMRHLSWSL